MGNKFKLKKFLATASAFAMITSASSAMGAEITTSGLAALSNGAGWVGGVAPVDGDSIKLGGAHPINADFADRIISQYDLNGNLPIINNINENLSLGNVIDSTGGANKVGFNFKAAGKTLTLTGTGNTNLGYINFEDKASTLIVEDGVNVGTVGASSAPGFGTLVFNGNGDVSTVGLGHKLTLVHLKGDANTNVNFTNKLSATTTKIDAGKLTLTSAKTITSNVELTAATSELNFADAGTVTGTIGAVGDLGKIVAAGAGNVDLQGVVKVATLNVANAGANVKLAKNFTGEVQFSQNGQVTVADAKTITGDVVALADKVGKLVFTAGASGAVTGKIGSESKALKLVEVTNAGDIAISANAHYSETFNFKDANAQFVVANGGKLVGNLTASAGGDGKVQFTKIGAIEGTIGKNGAVFGLVNANGAGAVTIGAGEHFTTLDVSNDDASFIMSDGANLTGNITNTGNAGKSAVTFEGNSKITGLFAANAAEIKDLNANGGADKTVEITGKAEVVNLNIGKGSVKVGDDLVTTNIVFTDADSGTLIVDGNKDHAIGGLVAQDVAKKSHGTIVISDNVANKTVAFSNKIGDSATDAALALLDIQNTNAAGKVSLVTGSHITKIKAAGAGTLSIAGDQKIGSVELAQSGQLGLEITADTKIVNAVDLGETGSTLGKITFVGDNTLTLVDGVNIVASELDTGAPNNGTLTFEGASVFDAAVTGANTLKAINVNGAKTVRIEKETKVFGDVSLAAGSTLELGGNITATDIKGAAVNSGTLKFVNAAASTVTGTVGAGNTLKAIEFSGDGDVEFVGVVTHTGDFKFDAKNAMQVTFDIGTDVGANNFVNASADAGVNHTVLVQKDNTVFTGEVAKDTAATNQIIFQLGKAAVELDASIGGADTSGAIFRTATNDKSKLNFNFAGGTVHSVGTSGKQLLEVKFIENGTITNGVFAKGINVDAAKTASLGGEIGGTNGVALANAGSTVTLLDGFTLNTKVVATTANQGVVNIAGGTLNNDIATVASRAKTVNFPDVLAQTLNMNANVFATEANLGKGTVKSVKAVTIDATNISAVSSTLDTNGGDITLNGTNVTLSGDNVIKVALTQAGNKVTGNQVVNHGDLTIAANTTLVTIIDDTKIDRPRNGETYTYTSLKNEGTVNAASKSLTVNANGTSTDQWINWTSEVLADGTVFNTGSDNSGNAITNALGANVDSSDAANIKALGAAATGTDASKFYDSVLRNVFSDKEKLDEAIERLTTVTTATDAIEGTMGNVSNMLGARVGSLGGIQSAGTPVQSGLVRKTASTAITGVSAGDDHARYGAWFSPFFSKTTQKARKNAAGYKDTTYGGSLGMDTRANDDLIIGGAFTFADSEMKHTDRKSGDKTKVNSLMFSIYAMQQITDTWFAQGSATMGSNDVKNSERKVASLTTYETTEGKYNSMSFTGEALFGYNYATEDLTLTPMAGLRYSRVNSAGYKMTGAETSGQNLEISQKASNKLDVIFGAKIAGGTFDVNGMSVTPEMHGFINHDLIGKNPVQNQRIGGVSGSLDAKSRKPIKTTYNLGLGVNADYGMMEYGVGYDLNLAEKRVGHEGSLKIRVNF